MLLPDVQVVNFGYPNPVVDHGIREESTTYKPSNQIKILEKGHQQKSIVPDYATDSDMADEQRKSLCQLKKKKKKKCYEQSKEESPTS